MSETVHQMEVIDHTGLHSAHKVLLPKPPDRGNDKQKDLIRKAASDPESFVSEIRAWGAMDGSKPEVLPVKLTERQFLDPPWETEVRIYETWKELSTGIAARPGTWTSIHLALIEAEIIEPSFLAADSNSLGQSGKWVIHEALRSNEGELVDKCVRSILRRMGGIPAVRGYRTSFVDCPIAKAWWRHRYAQGARDSFLNHGDVTLKDLSNVLRHSKFWTEFIDSMMRRLTIIGSQCLRDSIVRELVRNDQWTKKQFKDFLNAIGQRCVSQCLPALPVHKIWQIIEEEIVTSLSTDEVDS